MGRGPLSLSISSQGSDLLCTPTVRPVPVGKVCVMSSAECVQILKITGMTHRAGHVWCVGLDFHASREEIGCGM